MAMATILICDDQPDILQALRIYLTPEGYRLLTAENGEQVLKLLETEPVDLILLDVMMPKMDGITATARIRQKYPVPIILLTAKSETEDKVLGLNMGADDYITKPFVPAEVLARVRSLLRRSKLTLQPEQDPGLLQLGGIRMDDNGKKVTVDGEIVTLTPIEYSILRFFLRNPGRVYSSQAIYEAVWQEPAYGCEGVVAVHIRHLREKIEINPSEPRYLKVVWGQGYKLEGGKI